MKLLMVCLGNICRSPMADGLLRKKVADIGLNWIVDSAGTANYHAGEAPDKRMRACARSFGVSIDDLRARQFVKNDFKDFDLIYVMDKSNYNNVLALSNSDEERAKVKLILDELGQESGMEVPDPYYGGEEGFIAVYKMLDEATQKIIDNYSND